MLLSKETTINVNEAESNIICHMGYAAYKLWNICNYERKTYNASSGAEYPDWYYQKKTHKDDLWYKSLPSQTAQEVCKILDKAWKSFFKLKETGGIENPQPPRFKHEPIPVTYMQNGILRLSENSLRLSLPKGLKKHMAEKYDIYEDYLFIENDLFNDMENIKQVKLYMPEDGTMRIIAVYEIPDPTFLPDNGHYLSVDLGIHNLMTCYDSNDKCFIAGREYLSIARKYDKEIARVQSQWSGQQTKRGIKYPKSSEHISDLYEKKRNCIHDYLHKVTKYIVSYCVENEINTVVIGDITGIRDGNKKSDVFDQQMHSLPFAKMTAMLEYKLNLCGIQLIKQNEAYSSQCSPLAPKVCKRHASPKRRINRGLYKHDNDVWNADCVGAYNIMRLFFQSVKKEMNLPMTALSSPHIIKVAV